jgi:dTDP-4-dehydrorhamnose 3,5-epimerase
MKFFPTELPGAFVIEFEPHVDERGFFTRTFCQLEFERHGLVQTVAQCNWAYNQHEGTLRGMHWRHGSSPEAKLVRVARGAILDVIVDLRPDSPTYLKHLSVELSRDNRLGLYVPCLFAHGFQTLQDDTDVLYHMSEYYDPKFDRGARWNDPAFNIQWPRPNPILNDRDRSYPDYES